MRKLARKPSPSLCLAEGRRTVAAALGAGAAVHELLVAPSLLQPGDEALVARAERSGVEVIEVDGAAFTSVVRGRRPDGLIATVERPQTSLDELDPPARALIAVAVGVERPGNLGTIIRTACASGVDAVVVADPCTDLFHPDVVRGSLGTIFRVPTGAASTAAARDWLRARSVRVLATSPSGETPYWRADYTGAVALVVGSERHGLASEWLSDVDARLSVPMPGHADSLNVAVAAGIVLFEACRCRGRLVFDR